MNRKINTNDQAKERVRKQNAHHHLLQTTPRPSSIRREALQRKNLDAAVDLYRAGRMTVNQVSQSTGVPVKVIVREIQRLEDERSSRRFSP
jgi:hypothetical protein